MDNTMSEKEIPQAAPMGTAVTEITEKAREIDTAALVRLSLAEKALLMEGAETVADLVP